MDMKAFPSSALKKSSIMFDGRLWGVEKHLMAALCTFQLRCQHPVPLLQHVPALALPTCHPTAMHVLNPRRSQRLEFPFRLQPGRRSSAA